MKKNPIAFLTISLIFLGVLLPNLAISRPMTPSDAIKKLKEGNARFAKGEPQTPRRESTHRKALITSQEPFAAVLSCSDSRVPLEILFDQGLGDLFVIRVAGNTPDEFVWGSLEFAVNALKVPLIAVIGHENCGAVNAAMSSDRFPGSLGKLIDAIRGNLNERSCKKDASLGCGIKANVAAVVEKIQKKRPDFQKAVQEKKLQVIGGVYHLKTGWVQWEGEEKPASSQ